ncbi:eukaryotic translation initiation factor 5B-like [Penaeus monodon]|uniref:eukaryotic translation initiation factor 5B-like n=1 Tax=Penaeus monodon TaxID=6687 RepID=UPI0018A7DE20|nr:eukaryotic translation initiation factor 5B-like [Penaeus monodon]
MLRLMTPRAVLLGLAFLLVGVSALLDEGAGVWAGKSGVGEGALKKGRARRMEPKFVTPHKPENRRRHDWNMFDEEGESPTRRKRAPKKTRRMAAEEKYKYEIEKRKRMERRTREARIAENEGEWRGEGERRRMRKVRSAENEGGWRNEGQRKKMRRVRRAENEGEWKGEGKRRRIRKLKKAGNEGESRNGGDRRRRKEEKKAEKGGEGGGRGQGRKENGNTIVNNGKGEKFGRKRGEKMKKKTEEANKERRKEVKKMTKKLDDTTRRKVATKDKDKKNKNKKKKEKGSGEETYVLGEVTTKFNSDSKGKCIATDAVLGTDSVVVYTTNQKKKSKCKIKIRGKKGTKLTMQCSRFSLEDSGCNAETLQVFDKGSKETTKFCQDDNPGDAFSLSTNNQIQLKYKKKKFRKKDSEVSLGFVCKVAVEGSTQADLLLGNEEDCGKTFDLEIGQSAVVASTASGGSCSISLNGKSGSVLSIECPYLNFKRKCRAEDLYVEDLNGFESFRLCKGSTDLPFSVTTSRMRLTYTRDKATQWGDFVCRITAVVQFGHRRAIVSSVILETKKTKITICTIS